jgi:hypothetical protein
MLCHGNKLPNPGPPAGTHRFPTLSIGAQSQRVDCRTVIRRYTAQHPPTTVAIVTVLLTQHIHTTVSQCAEASTRHTPRINNSTRTSVTETSSAGKNTCLPPPCRVKRCVLGTTKHGLVLQYMHCCDTRRTRKMHRVVIPPRACQPLSHVHYPAGRSRQTARTGVYHMRGGGCMPMGRAGLCRLQQAASVAAPEATADPTSNNSSDSGCTGLCNSGTHGRPQQQPQRDKPQQAIPSAGFLAQRPPHHCPASAPPVLCHQLHAAHGRACDTKCQMAKTNLQKASHRRKRTVPRAHSSSTTHAAELLNRSGTLAPWHPGTCEQAGWMACLSRPLSASDNRCSVSKMRAFKSTEWV